MFACTPSTAAWCDEIHIRACARAAPVSVRENARICGSRTRVELLVDANPQQRCGDRIDSDLAEVLAAGRLVSVIHCKLEALRSAECAAPGCVVLAGRLDDALNRDIARRVADKCYLPANRLLGGLERPPGPGATRGSRRAVLTGGGAARCRTRRSGYEQRDRVSLGLEHDLLDVSDVLAVCLQRPWPIAVDIDAVEVVAGEHAASPLPSARRGTMRASVPRWTRTGAAMSSPSSKRASGERRTGARPAQLKTWPFETKTIAARPTPVISSAGS